MSPPGPARLYASIAAPILLVVGLAGFLRSADFSTGIDVFLDRGGLLGMDVNGWINLLHVTAGLVLLAALTVRPRLIALLVGAVLVAAGVAGRSASIEDGTILFEVFAVDPAGDWFRIVIGGAGVALGLLPVREGRAAPRRPARRGKRAGAGLQAEAGASETASAATGTGVSMETSAVPHPNTVTFEELRSLGTSMDAAARFVQTRERLGGFRTPEDLAEAPGLPPELAERLRDALSP